MEYKICLSKKLIIFYALFSPILIYGSIINLINVITGTGSLVSLGAFGLLGFIVLPVAIFGSYINNLCTINASGIKIGKQFFEFPNHKVAIVSHQLPFAERPLVSLWKSTYYRMEILDAKTGQERESKELDIFNSERRKLAQALQELGVAELTR